MTTTPNAPVLTKVPSEKQVEKQLVKISTMLEEMPSEFLKTEKKNRKKTPSHKPKKNDNSITDLKNEFESFNKFLSKEVNTVGLSPSDLKKYSEQQKKTFEKLNDTLRESFEEYRDAILSKQTELTETDKKNLSTLSKLEKEFESKSNSPTKEDPIQELRNSIRDFVKPIDEGVDVTGLSKKDAKKYVKTQNKESFKKQEEIREALIDTKESILKKQTLTDEDKKVLKDINNYQIALKEYGVKKDTKFQKWIDSKSDELNSNIKKGRDDLADTMATTLLGPLNLLVQPLMDVFDFKLSDLFGKDDEFTKKGKKIKPRRGDILKSNPETIYQTDELKKTLLKNATPEEKESDDTSGVLSKILGPMIGNMLPGFLKTAGPLLLSGLSKAGWAGLIATAFIAAGKLRSDQEDKKLAEATADQEAKRQEVDSAVSELGLPQDVAAPKTALEYQEVAKKKSGIDVTKRGNYWALDQDGTYYVGTKPDMSDGIPWVFSTGGQMAAVADMAPKEIRKKAGVNLIDMANGNALTKILVMNKGYPLKFHTGGIVPGKQNQEVPAILQAGEKVLTKQQQKHFDSDNMQVDLMSISKSFEQATKGNEVVDLLKTLIKTIDNKPFNNNIMNQTVASTNFNQLREALS